MSESVPGPLAEEAVKLVEAIGEWARSAGSGLPGMSGLSGLSGLSTSGRWPGHGAHLDGPECQVCPVCQLLAVLRRTQPETFGHLADASASLLAAFRTVVERREPDGGRASGVERIDLDQPDEPGDAGFTAEGVAQ